MLNCHYECSDHAAPTPDDPTSEKLDSLMIRKYLNTVAKQREMLKAGEKLGEYMDIFHENPVALTPPAVQRLIDVYKRHLALMAPVGLCVPEAPPDAALDAPRFFFFLGSLVVRHLER